MAIKKSDFRGQPELRDYPDPGSSTLDMIQNMTGAEAMQSSISRGGQDGMQGPGHDPIDPRRLWSTHIGNERLGVIPSGSELHHNQASTGRHQPEKKLITGERAPKTTGVGEGDRIVKTYGPGGVGGPLGLTMGGGNLGKNTGQSL